MVISSITTPVPAVVGCAIGLIVTGWAIANAWQLVWLRRMRARNLRIVADLRRLTDWRRPLVRREPGNWESSRHRPQQTAGWPDRATPTTVLNRPIDRVVASVAVPKIPADRSEARSWAQIP